MVQAWAMIMTLGETPHSPNLGRPLATFQAGPLFGNMFLDLSLSEPPPLALTAR
jgi:hypothetical protein